MALDAFSVELDSPEAVRVAAANLVESFQAVADRAQEVRGTWLALGGFYRAPEQEVLLSAMNTPADRADTLAGQARVVGGALEVFADALADLHAKRAVLATDIAGFYAERAEVDAENEHNNVLEDIADALDGEQEKLLAREDDLAGRLSALQAAKDQAEVDCANTIGALWGAERFEASDRAAVGDSTTYGMSADGYDALTRAGDAPWGRPVMWDSDNWLVRANMFLTGAGESITGTIGFVGDLTGFGEDGAATAAWSGLGQLAADGAQFASLPALVISARTDPDGTQQAADRLKEVGKNTIGWDTWDTSGWYTSGGLGLDVALTAASLGAGGAVKGSARAAAATRFTRLLDSGTIIDIRTAATAARLRLTSTLTARLDHLTTIGDDLAAHLDQLQPATIGPPPSRTVLDSHTMRHEPSTGNAPSNPGKELPSDLTNHPSYQLSLPEPSGHSRFDTAQRGQSQSAASELDQPIRRDDDFYADRNQIGQRKAHLNEAGDLVPANPEGRATIVEHVIGRGEKKSDSPYTSFSIDNIGAKIFGRETMRLNVDQLRRDIASGSLADVRIYSPAEVQAEIQASANAIAGRHVDISISLDAPKAEIRRLAKSFGLTPELTEILKQRIRDMRNTTRDQEWLIKGTIPNRYLSGPFFD
ncbi:MAG: hypothetical protein ACRCY8_18385 [Dermatophilaceae bacterium]